MKIIEVTASQTHALRRLVLRDNDATSDVHFRQDDDPASFHLAAVLDDGDLVAVATFTPANTPWRDDEAWQLRGMAVRDDQRGRGVGSALLRAAEGRIREAGAPVLWCNARDTAIGFYEALGFAVLGDGFLTAETGVPHHAMVRDL